ncbi:MAG: hypothetical protein ACJARL_002279 [Halopseudomonas sp.]|jgi:hypothetical protein
MVRAANNWIALLQRACAGAMLPGNGLKGVALLHDVFSCVRHILRP